MPSKIFFLKYFPLRRATPSPRRSLSRERKQSNTSYEYESEPSNSKHGTKKASKANKGQTKSKTMSVSFQKKVEGRNFDGETYGKTQQTPGTIRRLCQVIAAGLD